VDPVQHPVQGGLVGQAAVQDRRSRLDSGFNHFQFTKLLLQLKETEKSVLADHAGGTSEFDNHGERVVGGSAAHAGANPEPRTKRNRRALIEALIAGTGQRGRDHRLTSPLAVAGHVPGAAARMGPAIAGGAGPMVVSPART